MSPWSPASEPVRLRPPLTSTPSPPSLHVLAVLPPWHPVLALDSHYELQNHPVSGGGMIYAERLCGWNAVMNFYLRVMDGNDMLGRSVRGGQGLILFTSCPATVFLFFWLLVTGLTTPAPSQNPPKNCQHPSPNSTPHSLPAAVDRWCLVQPSFTLPSAPAPLCGAGKPE